MKEKLLELIALPSETEWLEFKEAKNDFDFNELGRYFSALSNAARLHGVNAGWLIFGVTNTPPRQVVGTGYCHQPPGLEKRKQQIAQHTNHRLTFRHIHEITVDGKRVLMFEIPPAIPGTPTTWDGIAYGRSHDRLEPLRLDQIDQIRRSATYEDWSAEKCPSASVQDLDPEAIAFARQQYLRRNQHLLSEASQWSDETFLHKAKVLHDGRVTRAAIILLGRPESATHLTPAAVRISWILRDDRGIEQDFAHFEPPILLAVDKVFAKIRNVTYRYLPDSTLFPTEFTQYDPWVIREVLHNAIAHQDYTKGGHINIVELPDSLLVTNMGSFLPGSVEAVIRQDSPPSVYRNRLLAEAMVNFNMIDTIGSGIKRMFNKQRERFFPMPDYDLSQPERVSVRIFGRVLDERYTRLLIERTDLSLWEVIALDKVQKGKPLTDDEFQMLKKKRLIEGRRPNLFVSASIAAATETRADYIKRRRLDKKHYMRLVQEYLVQFGVATRMDIENLLMDKLSEVLNNDQKRNFIMNLLQEMRREGIIRPVAGKRGRGARWELCRQRDDERRIC